MNLIYSNIGEFYPQSKPEFGSLLLIKIRAVESHIGIYVGNNRFLHTTKTTGSVIDRTERFKETITGAWGVR
jgi:cell wall-associated NlpC family hydrolase